MQLNTLTEHIPVILNETKFWLIRTMSGDFFQDYLENKFVAFGLNEISYDSISSAIENFPGNDTKDREQRIRMLGQVVSSLSKQEDISIRADHSNYWANQVLKFCYDIHNGDYVIIPSYSSNQLAIGIVQDSKIFIQTHPNNIENACDFYKRKRVRWIKTFYRDSVAPQLYPLFASRHAITEADNYSDYILNEAYDTYIRNGDLHSILHVRTTGNLSIWDYGFYMNVADLTEKFFLEQNTEVDIRSINLRSRVQSPGIFEFISNNVFLLWVFSAITVMIIGGEVSFLGFKMKTPGILKSISDFLLKAENMRLIKEAREKMNKMEIKGPEEIERVIKQYAVAENVLHYQIIDSEKIKDFNRLDTPERINGKEDESSSSKKIEKQ